MDKEYFINITVLLSKPETWEEGLVELKASAERLEMLLIKRKINDSGR